MTRYPGGHTAMSRVPVSKSQHNQMFPKRQWNWKRRAEHWSNGVVWELRMYATWQVKLINLVMLPWHVLAHGLPRTAREMQRLLFQNRTRSYSRDAWALNPSGSRPTDHKLLEMYHDFHQ